VKRNNIDEAIEGWKRIWDRDPMGKDEDEDIDYNVLGG